METSGPPDVPPQTPIKPSRLPSVRRFLRFSLRGLLLLILVLSVWLAWQVNRAHKQRRAIARVHGLGGSVIFDYQFIPMDHPALHWDPQRESPGPDWLRTLIGEEYFRDVIAVDFRDKPIADDDLELLVDIPDVQYVFVAKTPVGDGALAIIAKHSPHLKLLDAGHTHITNAGLRSLERLSHLEFLVLSRTRVSSDGLKHLAPLSKMRSLMLDGTDISDEGLACLSNMTYFDDWLGLTETLVSDDGLKQLAQLKRAKTINLLRSRVTNKGGAWLTQQLPNCDVSYDR